MSLPPRDGAETALRPATLKNRDLQGQPHPRLPTPVMFNSDAVSDQNDQCDAASLQVLLVADAPVGREQQRSRVTSNCSTPRRC